MDILTTQYDFAGKVLGTHLKHQKSGVNPQQIEVSTKNLYDDLDRMIRIEKNINNTGWKAIAVMEYDTLGYAKYVKLICHKSVDHLSLFPAFNNELFSKRY